MCKYKRIQLLLLTTISFLLYNGQHYHNVADALTGSSSSSSSNDGVLSRIKTAQCALQVSVGRVPGTAMPKEWAASGTSLVFNLEVEFDNELCAEYDMTKERLLITSSSSRTTVFNAAVPLNTPTFIATTGQQTIQVTAGAYGCELLNPQSQQYKLRFFLDFPEGAVRNDVELPAERVYFISSCWVINNKNNFNSAQQRYNELQQTLDEIQQDITQIQLESSRSKNIFGKVKALQQTAVLMDQKKKLEPQLYNLQQSYPLQDTTRQELVEGPNDLLFVKKGMLAVKRYRGTLNTQEQYHWIGTFSFQEFFEDVDNNMTTAKSKR